MKKYSNGLNDVRKNWEVPPGMDAGFVKEYIPTPDEVIDHFEDKIDISTRTISEIAIINEPELDRNLFVTKLADVNTLDSKVIALSNNNPEIETSLKSMFNSMRNGKFRGAVSGGFLRVNYDLPSGDQIDMVYDLRKKGHNYEGIKLSSFLQTNVSNEVLDLGKMVPNSDIRYKHIPWYWYLLRPALMNAGMSVYQDKVSIYKSFFDKDVYRNELAPAVLFSHEEAHRWFRSKYPEISNRSTEYIIGNMGISGVDILSILLAIGINPWYLLPSVAVHLASYSQSRDRKSFYGQKAHANLINESHSDFTEYVLADYLQRRGFYVGENIKDIESLTTKFVINYMLAYQPLPWGLIDLNRFMIGKINSAEDAKPRPSYAS